MSEMEPQPNWQDVSIPLEELMQTALRDAVLLLVVPLLIHLVMWGIGEPFAQILRGEVLLLALPTVLVFIVAHEIIHAVTWKFLSGLPWSQIQFGFDRATLSPYCHATSPMTARVYRIGAAMPGILTGLLPLVYGLVMASAPWTLLGAFMTSAAVGDLYVLRAIKDVPGHARVIDHPKNAGCYVVE